MSERKWGSVRFRVYELLIMRRCLNNLEILENLLNKQNLTLEPLIKITEMRSRLDRITDNYNLHNPYALIKRRSMTLKCGEWKTLQNSLCVTIGIQEAKDNVFPKEMLIGDEVFKVVKKLHRRFELFPVRVASGLRAKGYLIDETKVKKLAEEYATHDSDTAIKQLNEVSITCK